MSRRKSMDKYEVLKEKLKKNDCRILLQKICLRNKEEMQKRITNFFYIYKKDTMLYI